MNEESPDGKKFKNIELNNIIDNNYKLDAKEIEIPNLINLGKNLKITNQTETSALAKKYLHNQKPSED